MFNRKMLVLALLTAAISTSTFARGGALSLIPNNAATVGVVRLADVRNSPISSTLLKQTDKFGGDGDAEAFLTEAGLQPSKDVDVLMVATSNGTQIKGEPEILVVAEGRFNADRLNAALLSRGAQQKNGYLILPASKTGSNEHTGAAAFPDAHLAILGSEAAVVQALADRAAGGTSFLTASGLGRDYAHVDPQATAWALVDVARASRLSSNPMHADSAHGQALASAMKNVSTIAIWATDSGDALKLGGYGFSHDSETLGLLEDTLRGALASMRLAVQDKNPEMVSVLRQFVVSRNAESVSIAGSISGETLKSLEAKVHHASR